MAPPTASSALAPTTHTSTTTAATVATATTSLKPPRENHHKENHQIASDILDDLSSRFIINVPVEERSDFIRMCFQIELAHWFYLDFYCSAENTTLVPCGIKQFAFHIFHHIPFLKEHLHRLTDIMNDFKLYKMSVPTYGAILMTGDQQRVLLVQSFLAKSSWGFPKGKVNEDEEPLHCAVREVYEETGFDIAPLIRPDDFIEGVLNYQYTRLYIVPNVPADTAFAPRTRMEIKACTWFQLDLLPTHKMDPVCREKLGINANSFFMIMPFVKRLKRWVVDQQRSTSGASASANGANGGTTTASTAGAGRSTKGGTATGAGQQRRQRHKSLGDLDGVKVTSSTNGSSGRQQPVHHPIANSSSSSSSNDHQTAQRTANGNGNPSAGAAATQTSTATDPSNSNNRPRSLLPATAAVSVVADTTKQSAAKSANFKRQLFTLQQQQQQQSAVVSGVPGSDSQTQQQQQPQHHSDPLAVAQRASGMNAGHQQQASSRATTASTIPIKKRRPIQSFLNGLNGDPAVQKWKQFAFVVRPELESW